MSIPKEWELWFKTRRDRVRVTIVAFPKYFNSINLFEIILNNFNREDILYSNSVGLFTYFLIVHEKTKVKLY